MNMKRILKVLLVLILTLLVSVLGCSLILRHTKINVKAATNILFSKIPFLNQFVETSSPTSIYNISVIDKQELRTASYNVDFFVSFKQGDDKHIAIYPFIVEAGIDLKSKRISEYDSLTVVTLPNAEISVADITDDGINVIRSSENLDYNTHIKPVRMALEMRAKDLAIEHGILSNANKVAEDYLTNLFNKSPLYVFQKEAAPHDTTTTINAALLPIEFNFRERNLEKGYLKFKTDSLYKRDNLEFTSHESRFGFIKKSKGFPELESEITSPNSILCKYVDPIDPRLTRLYFDASDDYRKIYVVTHDEAYYLESLHQGSEVQRQIIAPDMLYLAMGIKHTEDEIDESYKDWLENYNKTFTYLTDSSTQYNPADRELAIMEYIRDINGRDISREELIMKSFTRSYVYPSEDFIRVDNEIFNSVQEIIYLLQNNQHDKMDPNFQLRVLGLNEKILNDEDKRLLMQLFYPLSVTRIEEKIKYKNELIKKSPNYNKSIAYLLQGKDFCEYIYNLLHRGDSHIQLWGAENKKESNFSNITITEFQKDLPKNRREKFLKGIGNFGRSNNSDFGGDSEILKEMEKYGLTKEDKGQLVYIFVNHKPLKVDELDILIIERDMCHLITNIDGYFASRKLYTCTYKGINQILPNIKNGTTTFPGSTAVRTREAYLNMSKLVEISDYELNNKAITELLYEIVTTHNSTTKDFNESLIKRLRDKLLMETIKECKRPSLDY